MIGAREYIPRASERRARRGAIIATVCYFVAIGLALLFVKFVKLNEQIEEHLYSNSLMISLGDSDLGMGELTTPETVRPTAPNPVSEVEQQVEQLTDEMSDVEYVEPTQSVEEVKISSSEEQVSEPKSEPTPIREVDRRALFPGSANRESASHGNTTVNKGVQGVDSGTPERESVLGDGLVGNYSLTGRSLIGALPIPSYRSNSEGRVVITITVDELGRVTSASPHVASSTTNDATLIKAAREAALKARFTDSKEFLQSGTITYHFKMM